MESVIFYFDPKSFEESVKACATTPTTPLILKYLPKTGLVLEAGCGVGNVVKYLTNKGYNIMGVELNKELVDAINKEHPEMDIRYGNVNKLSFADNTFEGMVSLGVVEHTVEGPKTALKEALRVLKPGGLAIFTVPLFNSVRKWKYLTGFAYLEHFIRLLYYKLRKIDVDWLYKKGLTSEKKKFLYHRWPICGNFFEYRFKPKEFNNLLLEAGFEIVETLPFDAWGGLAMEFGGFFVKNIENPGIVLRTIKWIFSLFPYSHQHMYFTLVRKPIHLGQTNSKAQS